MCAYVLVHVCMCLTVHTCLCPYVCMYLFVPVCSSKHVCGEHICLWILVCAICLHIPMFVPECVCTCLYLFVLCVPMYMCT